MGISRTNEIQLPEIRKTWKTSKPSVHSSFRHTHKTDHGSNGNRKLGWRKNRSLPDTGKKQPYQNTFTPAKHRFSTKQRQTALRGTRPPPNTLGKSLSYQDTGRNEHRTPNTSRYERRCINRNGRDGEERSKSTAQPGRYQHRVITRMNTKTDTMKLDTNENLETIVEEVI